MHEPIALAGALGGELARLYLDWGTEGLNGEQVQYAARAAGTALINLVDRKVAAGECSASPKDFLDTEHSAGPEPQGWGLACDETRYAPVTNEGG